MTTADALDRYGDSAQVCLIPFRSFGRPTFSGRIATVRCHEDNVLLRTCLGEPGEGRVLVVDGGGSRRCALLGDSIAALALETGWAGVVLDGCVRDSATLASLELGVKALGRTRGRAARTGPARSACPSSSAA